MRTSGLGVCGLGLLLVVARAHAGSVELHWEHDLAWQRDTTYRLRIVTLQGGRPTATERTLDPFPAQQCAPDPARTPDTLCGTVCLEPGDYTLSLTAVHRGQQSGASNTLDLDLTSSTSCTPGGGTPPAAVASPPPSTAAPVVAGAAVVVGGTLAGGGGTGGVPSWTSLVNLACVHWHVEGPCFCGPFTPCVTVSYYEPAWLVEVVKRPGDTVLPVIGTLLGEALHAAGVPALGGGGAGNSSGSGQTNLFYGEVHVVSFPQLLGGPCTACAPATVPFALHYASEIDAASWRTATAVPSPLSLLLQVGTWGPLYPRGGKVIHSSEPVASALAAVRGMDIAHQPVGTPPNVEAHVVTQLTEERASCIQMAWPALRPCMPPGVPPVLWESGTLSATGKYILLFWRRRSCCVNPALTTCGITLAGGHGQNTCILPPVP